MTGLELLLAIAGVGVTVLVVLGMVLLTPRGVVPASPRPRGADEPEEAAAEPAAVG